MNTELWQKIQDFDFDQPLSEYGFSVRLAHENYWTKNFTRKAILEYKKFMYLAATSDMMVSPSEVIDTVWHQHLIFTRSYQDFCQLLGKQIQHVPSTHNKSEVEKFQQAKERTIKIYASIFGNQPVDIWGFAGMYESMELEKARLNIRTSIILGILALTISVLPAYYGLRPLYVKIPNPGFIFAYVTITLCALIGLEIYNTKYLKDVLKKIKRVSFLWHLDPYEVLFLKTRKIDDVISGHTNKLVIEQLILVDRSSNKIEAVGTTADSHEGTQILESTIVDE